MYEVVSFCAIRKYTITSITDDDDESVYLELCIPFPSEYILRRLDAWYTHVAKYDYVRAHGGFVLAL